MSLKKTFVGTPVGRLLVAASHWKSLHSVSLANPETAHCVANDILADRLVAHLCPPQGTFVDIGAHIGSILSVVHHNVPGAKIIAFEADPSKIAHLKRRYPYCELFDVALGEQDGTAQFQINSSATGYNTLVIEDAKSLPSISVTVATLDGVLGARNVDLIKIDVEGAELGVLMGGEKLIQSSKPTLMFESTGAGINALGYSPDLLWRWLTDHGYLIFTPDRLAHDANALTRDAFLDGHQYPFHTHNYFAVHSDRRTAVRDRARAVLGIRPTD